MQPSASWSLPTRTRFSSSPPNCPATTCSSCAPISPTKRSSPIGSITLKRVNASSKYRGLGLGRRLTAEIFEVARGLGLKKLTAQMTPDQSAARSAFEHLGFQVEAVLTDWVEDRKGHPRDLLIMTHDVSGFSDRIVA
jgi:GNAT superfamily N-acetyltransferase